jgi:hypothetical protein
MKRRPTQRGLCLPAAGRRVGILILLVPWWLADGSIQSQCPASSEAWMDPGVTAKAIALLDRTILSIIIALRFLSCLSCIGALLLFSGYPGADFGVSPAILFYGAGIATTVVLQKNQKKEFWRRLPAMLWNALFVGYAVLGRGLSASSAILTFNVCAAIYLGATAAIGFAATRTLPRLEE